MNFEFDREVLLSVDGARLKVLTEFVGGLTHAQDTDVINGTTLRNLARAAMEKSIEAGRQAFYRGSLAG